MARKTVAESNNGKKTIEVQSGNEDARVERTYVGFNIRFRTPIIMHAFDQKAVEEILHRQLGHAVEQLPKVPAECIERAIMRNTEGKVCLLASSFKKAITSAASGFQLPKGVRLRSQLYVEGHSVPITYKEQVNRMDMVKVGPWNNRTVDVRFRPQFNEARCRIVISSTEKLTQDLVVQLLNRAGNGGLGEMRPQKTGCPGYGEFVTDSAILTVAEIKEVLMECSHMVPPLVIPEWALNAEISPVLLARIMSEQSGARDDE